jgi:hypothetical protein
MNRFDLNKLDPLVMPAAPKTAADIEWDSWMRELGERRTSAWVDGVVVRTERLRDKLDTARKLLERIDATNAMNEALQEVHTAPPRVVRVTGRVKARWGTFVYVDGCGAFFDWNGW